MDKKQVYRGIVRTGRGAGVGFMSAPGVLDRFQRLTGLSIIPGTLNAGLAQPFDVTLLTYTTVAELGVVINLAELGIEYDGETGFYYSQVVIADKCPGCILLPTWAGDPLRDAELVSPYHLRRTLDLRDGDSVEFTLVRD